MEIFKILGTIAISGKDEAKQDITETTEHAEKKSSKLLGALGKIGAAAVAAGATAVAAVGKQALSAYADYEQLVGGVETLFGASYASAEEYAEKTGSTLEFAQGVWDDYGKRQQTVLDNAANAYKTAGMSANEYMETVTGFAASLNASLGQYQWQSANYADMIITDMSDNANKMGTDIESIKNAYAGFSKGNFTMLDNLKLGYGGTKEEMERLLRKAEELEGYDFGALSIDSFADVSYAIHVVQEELGIAGTTAKEASTTIQGSLASMKSAWQNLTVGIADENANMDVLIGNFVDSVATAGQNLLPRIEQIFSGMGSLIEKLAPIIGEALPNLIETLLPSLLSAGLSFIMGLAEGITSNFDALLDAAFQVIEMLLNGIIDNLPRIIEMGIELTGKLAVGLIQAIPDLVLKIPEIISAIVRGFKDSAPKILEIGKDIVRGVWDGIKNMVSWITDKVRGFFSGIVDGVKNFLGIRSPSKVFAGIGGFMAEGLGEGFEDQFKSVKKGIENNMNFSAAKASIHIQQNGQGLSGGFAMSNMPQAWQPAYAGAAAAQPITIPITLELDGTVLARKTYIHNQAEIDRRGKSFVR